jgi:hypothetical protein
VLRNIAAHPERYPLLQESDIRSAKVKRFPYRVVYVVVGEVVDIIAVGARKAAPRLLAPPAEVAAGTGPYSLTMTWRTAV